MRWAANPIKRTPNNIDTRSTIVARTSRSLGRVTPYLETDGSFRSGRNRTSAPGRLRKFIRRFRGKFECPLLGAEAAGQGRATLRPFVRSDLCHHTLRHRERRRQSKDGKGRTSDLLEASLPHPVEAPHGPRIQPLRAIQRAHSGTHGQPSLLDSHDHGTGWKDQSSAQVLVS